MPLHRVLCTVALLLAGCDTSRPQRRTIDAGCPVRVTGEPVAIEDRCHSFFCTGHLEQRGCTLELSLAGCVEGTTIGSVSSTGEVTFRPSDQLGRCVETRTETEASFAAVCTFGSEVCSYEFYPQPSPPLELDLREVVVVDAPLRIPEESPNELLDASDPLEGWLSDLVVLDDRIVVGTFAGDWASADCRRPKPTRIVAYDLETLEVRFDREGPPCLTRLARDPLGPGFLAVYGAGSSTIARFDAEGIEQQQVAIVQPDLENRPRVAAALTSSADRVQLLIASQYSGGSAYFFSLDPRTLQPIATSPRMAGELRSGFDDGKSVFWASNRIDGVLLGFDRTSAIPIVDVVLATIRRVSDDAGRSWVDPSGRLIVSGTGDRPATWIIDEPLRSNARLYDTAVLYEEDAVPWAFAGWPGEPDWVMTGLVTQLPEADAIIARLSPRERRFLPGTARIGKGMVAALEPDHRGRIWALLSWTGRVVRLSPR